MKVSPVDTVGMQEFMFRDRFTAIQITPANAYDVAEMFHGRALASAQRVDSESSLVDPIVQWTAFAIEVPQDWNDETTARNRSTFTVPCGEWLVSWTDGEGFVTQNRYTDAAFRQRFISTKEIVGMWLATHEDAS